VDQFEAKNKLTGIDRDCQDKEMATNLLVSCSSCLHIPHIEPLPTNKPSIKECPAPYLHFIPRPNRRLERPTFMRAGAPRLCEQPIYFGDRLNSIW